MSGETTGHTPGPWVARPEWQSPYGVPIYAVNSNERDEREHIGNAYLEADARLIAAAPELLEALRGAARLLSAAEDFLEQLGEPELAKKMDDGEAKARAAIAKAEGRESRMIRRRPEDAA